ncbi:MAG: FHA domain-containing protein [Actinomycetota bacterium]|nr:FHA domain-containing protein [Actinomycetota bacterium]
MTEAATLPWRCPRGHGDQDGRYCETCGHDSEKPAERESTADLVRVEPVREWYLTAGADRAYHQSIRGAGEVAPHAVDFPRYVPRRRFPLHGERMLIGRRDPARGIEPEIDLSGAPEDRGVGRSHALLMPDGNGQWSIVDLHSTNHTYINDITVPITPDQAMILNDGDRIYLGAWTVLTVYESQAVS